MCCLSRGEREEENVVHAGREVQEANAGESKEDQCVQKRWMNMNGRLTCQPDSRTVLEFELDEGMFLS